MQEVISDVVYWRNPLVSGGVFGLGLFVFLLIGVYGYSSVTLACYLLMGHLIVRLVHTNGSRVLAEMNVIPKRAALPPAPEVFVTEEQVRARAAEIAAGLNAVCGAAYSMLAGDASPAALKTGAALFAIALVSRVLGSTGLFFLVFVGLFALPKTYELKKAEVDQLVAVAGKAAGDVWAQVLQKIPKASDLPKKEK